MEQAKGFRQILGKCKFYPKTVQSDYGKEFKNKWFSSMLTHHNIKQNFNITNSNKKGYIDVLQQLVELRDIILEIMVSG
jgi:transposase InsO family protein